MSALSPQQARAMRETVVRAAGETTNPPLSTLAQKWTDLHEQAARLAQLADLSPEPYVGALAAFPAQLGEASEWQRELAFQGMDDIDAMMRPGLTALATLTHRGVSAKAPALALWREFYDARSAVMGLAAQQA